MLDDAGEKYPETPKTSSPDPNKDTSTLHVSQLPFPLLNWSCNNFYLTFKYRNDLHLM